MQFLVIFIITILCFLSQISCRSISNNIKDENIKDLFITKKKYTEFENIYIEPNEVTEYIRRKKREDCESGKWYTDKLGRKRCNDSAHKVSYAFTIGCLPGQVEIRRQCRPIFDMDMDITILKSNKTIPK